MDDQKSEFAEFLSGAITSTINATKSLAFLQIMTAIIALFTVGQLNPDPVLMAGMVLVTAMAVGAFCALRYAHSDDPVTLRANGRWQIKNMVIAIVFPLLVITAVIDFQTGRSVMPIKKLADIELNQPFTPDETWEAYPASASGETIYAKIDDTKPNITVIVRLYHDIVYRVDMVITPTQYISQHEIYMKLNDQLEAALGEDRWFEDLTGWFDGRHVLVHGKEGVYAYVKDIRDRIEQSKRMNEALSLDAKLNRHLPSDTEQ